MHEVMVWIFGYLEKEVIPQKKQGKNIGDDTMRTKRDGTNLWTSSHLQEEMVCEGNAVYIVEDIAADIATYRIVRMVTQIEEHGEKWLAISSQ